MRASSLRAASVAGAILFALPLFAHAEGVTVMRVAMDVHADASISVSESIGYDFGEAERHGIFRDIQLSYKDQLGGRGEISLSDIAVTDEYGNPLTFSMSRSDGYEHIKIGDPDVLVSGEKTYVILYTVRGAIGYFEDHDEVYWNASGNAWNVPIREVDVAVWTPALAQSYACYEGPIGATAECASAVSRLDGTGKPVTLFTSGALAPGEGLTVGVGVAKGVLAEPTRAQKYWQLLMHNLPLALPFVTLAVLFSLWWKYGRDARGRGTIIPEYDAPDSLSVIEAAEIVNQTVKPADISALLIVLAVRGYLKIERIESKTLGIFKSVDYRFHRLKDTDDEVSPEEKILLGALFLGDEREILASQLKTNGKLRHALADISRSVEAKLVSEGYYRTRPAYVRVSFIAIGAVYAVLALALFNNDLTPLGMLAIALSGAIVISFAFIMPALTHKGALVREQILGLKEYLQIAEKNRLDFHNAPEKSPELFEKLLPYAMMLGVSAAWAKEFEGIYKEPPSWYAGGAYPVFSPTVFADDMKSFSTAAAALAAPTSGSGGSGGGGSSGGGFGGGGGGSW